MKHLVLTILICISFFSCSKTTLEPGPVRGVWVEASLRQDTLSFVKFDPDRYFTLDREREFRNGHSLPKSGSGPYDYILKNDSISIRCGWSNSLNFQTLYFKFDPQRDLIQIGNFYDDSKNAAAILSFTKLY